MPDQTIRVATLLLALLLSSTASAAVAPTLLALRNGSGSYWLQSASAQTPTGVDGMVFGLLFGWSGFYGGTSLFGMEAQSAIGDSTIRFVSGTTGVVDFNPSNSPDFQTFAALATDGVPKPLSSANLIVFQGALYNGQPFMGSVGTGPLTDVDTLAGAQLSFVRLVVQSVSYTVQPTGGLDFSFSTQATWQFWGVPAVASVSEPAQISLLTLGGLLLVARARGVRTTLPDG